MLEIDGRARSRRRRGVTLIELMVTISLMVVLGSLAVPGYRNFIINQKLSTTASDFLTALLQARSEAVRLGKPVLVVAYQEVNGPTASTYSWLDGWCIFVDNAANATYSSSTSTLIGCTQLTNVAGIVTVLTGSGKTSGPLAEGQPFFQFNPSGFAGANSTRYTGNLNGSLWLQATQANGTSRQRAIIVGRSGRARICEPSPSVSCSND